MARFLTDSRLLIQHIPRTGGTWVEQAIETCHISCIKWLQKQPAWLPSKHGLLSHYQRGQMARVDYVAAFVRNPVSYYASVWRWIRQSEVRRKELRPGKSSAQFLLNNWSWHPHRTAVVQWLEVGGMDGVFNDWVFLMLEREPLWCTRLIEQYVGPAGGEFCDFIGRTETLTDDFLLLMKSFGHRVDESVVRGILKKNTSKEPLELDPGLRGRIERDECLVMKRFYGDNQQERWYARVAQEGLASVVGQKPWWPGTMRKR